MTQESNSCLTEQTRSAEDPAALIPKGAAVRARLQRKSVEGATRMPTVAQQRIKQTMTELEQANIALKVAKKVGPATGNGVGRCDAAEAAETAHGIPLGSCIGHSCENRRERHSCRKARHKTHRLCTCGESPRDPEDTAGRSCRRIARGCLAGSGHASDQLDGRGQAA